MEQDLIPFMGDGDANMDSMDFILLCRNRVTIVATPFSELLSKQLKTAVPLTHQDPVSVRVNNGTTWSNCLHHMDACLCFSQLNGTKDKG